VTELKLPKLVGVLEDENFGNSSQKERPCRDPGCCSDRAAWAVCAVWDVLRRGALSLLGLGLSRVGSQARCAALAAVWGACADVRRQASLRLLSGRCSA